MISRYAYLITLTPSLLLAEAISVNFERNDTDDSITNTAMVGYIPASQWNNINVGSSGQHAISIPATALANNLGEASSTSLSVNLGSAYVGSSGAGTSTSDHQLMASYLSWDPVDGTSPEDSGSVTLANLPASLTSGYSVYVYFDADVNTRSFEITVDGTTKSAKDASTFNGTFNAASASPTDANYAVFTGLSAESFTIAMNSDTGRAALNGFQIISDDHPQPPAIASFTADDYYVSAGSSVALSWASSDATSLSITPSVGDVIQLDPNGSSSTSITPNSTTTYTLTASNAAGSTSKEIQVGVGPDRPNILLFVVDDMGSQDTSEPFQVDSDGNDIPSTLNSRYRTPSMEALAVAGMKFTHAYAMPVCTPSRCSIMSGQNAVRHHVTNWTSPGYNGETGSNSTSTHNSPTNWLRTGLDTSSPALPALLSQAGYRSIHAGKAHFGNAPENKEPLNIGFDINIAGSSIGHPGSYTGDYGQGGSRPVPGLSDYHNTGTFLTEALTLEMNKAIEQSVDDGVPFFAYMSHYAVHAPFTQDPRFTANYPTLSGNALAFATMIEGMDKSLGDIVSKIDTLGIAEDTLVIFISDNGSDSPAGSAPLRGKKGTKYEGGSRVPMIVAWAKANASNSHQSNLVIPAGSYEDELVTCFDIFPTILANAGVSHTNTIDGYDISPYLRGADGTHRPQKLLIHFPHDHNSDYYTFYREGNYKLIYNYASDSYELYDVVNDIDESDDLINSEPELAMTMARKMAQELSEHGAQWPTIDSSPDYDDPFSMPILNSVDTDEDGISDNSEDLNNNGLIDAGETNPENDNSDGDNVNDGDEAKLGTDPLDSSSAFKVESSSQPDGSFEISWPSAVGASFSLRSSADLSDWSTVVASNISASASEAFTSYNLGTPSAAQLFYQVELEE